MIDTTVPLAVRAAPPAELPFPAPASLAPFAGDRHALDPAADE